MPEYLPDKFGNWEPIDQVFEVNKRDMVLKHWRWPFLATKKKPRMDAGVWMRKGTKPLHASWDLTFRSGEVDVTRLTRFLQQAAKELEADFSCLTLFTETEIDFGRRNRTAWNLDKKATKFQFAIYSQFLQQCIPDVYWMTLFGAPYLKVFGKDHLLAAPVHKAEVLSDSIISLQLAPSLEDVSTDAMGFAETKKRLKTFLGEDAFFRVGKLGVCRRPEFVWR